MFDIGFSELLVIGVVALVVIGPEKLPRLARTLGHLAGKLQRYVSDVKADINREIELEDLKKMRDSMQQAASDFQSNFTSEVNKTEAELKKAADELNKTTDEITQSLNAAVRRAATPPPQEAFEAAPQPATPRRPPAPRPHERRAGKLHLPPDRAAHAADARGGRDRWSSSSRCSSGRARATSTTCSPRR